VAFTFYNDPAVGDCTSTTQTAGSVTLVGNPGVAHPSDSKGPLAAGFYAFRASYSGATTYAHVRSITDVLLSAKATNAAAFIDEFVELQRAKLERGKRLRAAERAFLRFLEDTRLVKRERWEDAGWQGRIGRLVEDIPPSLQGDVRRFRDSLVEGRRYRQETGEKGHSLGTEHMVLFAVARCATWLDEQGIDSWQQLTPARYRSYVAAHGGGPALRDGHLSRLRRFLDFLKGERRIFSNPLAHVRARRVRLQVRRVDRAAIGGWLQSLTDPATDPVVRAVGLLVLLHGLTLYELAHIRLGDYKERSRLLFIQRRALKLHLDPLTHDAITACRRARPAVVASRFLFMSQKTAKTGRPASTRYFHLRLASVGLPFVRTARQSLIRSVLLDENPAVAARLFGLSRTQIFRYFCALDGEKVLRNQCVEMAVPHSL
jgi:site-specific recombinase XerC